MESESPHSEDGIRETYEEYGDSDERFALIADPENTDAWIQSDLTRRVRR